MISWHKKNWGTVDKAWRQGRLPHALLLEGPAGLGKGLFARRLAALVLGVDPDSVNGDLAHPDLVTVSLLEKKKQIAVDQIRELCATLAMTSHSAGYKVAIVDPADRMNVNAANSLLKTLEEPTDDTLLILVRSRLDTLPATIASRCQRIRFGTPPEAVALEWLQGIDSNFPWTPLLKLCNGAPLAAAAGAEQALSDIDTRLTDDLAGIAAGELDPIQVAAHWNKLDAAICINWLSRTVTSMLRDRAVGCDEGAERLQNVNKDLPLEHLFLYLDEVQDALRRTDGALNTQMQLESLLIPWADRLGNV
jgi:DNA polymerase-3 subunit delta'